MSSANVAGIIAGYWQSQAVYVAAKLELADRLALGAKTAEQLAAETNVHETSLFRLLRALATLRLFRETKARTFEVTESGATLQKSHPHSQWAMAIMMGEEHYRAWGELLYSVQTGEGAFRKTFGRRIFEFLGDEAHSEQAAVFDAAMTSIHGRETIPLLEAYDFSHMSTLVDIGGGNGSLLVEFLRRHPEKQAVLFDLPHVVTRAEHAFKQAGVSERCRMVGGDFFHEVPSGSDVYFLRHIIHDWHDDEAITILKNIRRAMSPQARVIVAETIVPEGNDPAFVKWLDLTMLVIPEGRERTEAEYRSLFAAADLNLTRVIETECDVQLLEAVPVP